MTRRAFSALRVIRIQGQITSTMAQFFWANRLEKGLQLKMTRRAFSALRVIPRQGHMTSNLAQDFL